MNLCSLFSICEAFVVVLGSPGSAPQPLSTLLNNCGLCGEDADVFGGSQFSAYHRALGYAAGKDGVSAAGLWRFHVLCYLLFGHQDLGDIK